MKNTNTWALYTKQAILWSGVTLLYSQDRGLGSLVCRERKESWDWETKSSGDEFVTYTAVKLLMKKIHI